MSDTNASLPPLGSPWRADLTTNITEQQRAKWRKQWAKMDEDDCQRQHYKHYEWECRKAFEELERREQHLADALRRLAEVEAANRWIPCSERMPEIVGHIPHTPYKHSAEVEVTDGQRIKVAEYWSSGRFIDESHHAFSATHWRPKRTDFPPAPTTDSTPAVCE